MSNIIAEVRPADTPDRDVAAEVDAAYAPAFKLLDELRTLLHLAEIIGGAR